MNFPPPTDKQARIIWFALTGLAIGIVVTLIVAAIRGLGIVLDVLSPVLWPLAVAGILAYLLDPVVDRFEQRGLSRARAIMCVFAIALLIVTAIFSSIVPPIVAQSRQLIARLPEISTKIEARADYWINHPPAWLEKYLKDQSKPAEPAGSVAVTNDVTVSTTASTNAPADGAATLSHAIDKQTLQSATGWIAVFLRKAGLWVFSWFGVLVGLALIPIYTFYLLLEKRGIESNWTSYLPVADSRFKDELVFILRSINGYLIAFFRGQVLVAICDGILYGIGFLIVGLPYALLLGVAAMALTIIPFIGAIIIFFAAMVIALVQFGDWLHPLYVVAVFAVVQTMEGLVISPKIMGGRVGLHPLTIIIAVMIGTTLLGGVLGGILAIPLTAVLRVLLARYVWTRPKKP